MKFLFLIFFVSFNSYSSFTGVEEFSPGEVIFQSPFNDRLDFIEQKMIEVGLNPQIPRFNSSIIKAQDFNDIANYLESLSLPNFPTIDRLSSKSPIFASEVNYFFQTVLSYVQSVCVSPEDCYLKNQTTPSLIYNGEVLYEQNGYLYSSSRDKYLGTQCDEWYTVAEFGWIDKKLDSNLSNWLNLAQTAPLNTNVYELVNTQAPTCGSVYYYGTVNTGGGSCPGCGYSYFTINGDEKVSRATGSNSGVVEVNKGDLLYGFTHWGSYLQVRSGY